MTKIDTDEFDTIRKRFSEQDSARETIIKESRDILKASKQAIFALHRGDTDQAQKLLAAAQKGKEALAARVAKQGSTRIGSFAGACEEYCEALAFSIYLAEGRLVTLKEADVSPEEYLCGLADLTGELGRLAVAKATARDAEAVKAIKEFTEELYGQFVQFDFRNGELRRKYDSIKYNLQKMEQLLYELTVK